MKRTVALVMLIVATFATTMAQQKKNHNFEVAKNLDIFNNIYKGLDLMYVDTLNPQEVIGNGIAAMLRSLDPYTQYYPEEKTKDLKMMLTGKYAGIGSIIRWHQRLKTVVIDEPYAGMPAAEAGLKKGDIILSIDGQDMKGKATDYVSSRLKGDAGTSFLLKVKRPSTGKVLKLKMTRQNIKEADIPYYGMLNNDIAYINFFSFTEGCARNMRKAFIELKNRGAKKLVLDLRSNGGGSVQEAVDIVNMWVPKGTTIISQKGKLPQANHDYVTRLEPVDTLMPIVVMVGGATASSSEITCGSLQDLDRAVILGTRTYGKGLVQAPIDVPYNGSLKLTTGKYYIPSGRCIQAINYKHSGGGYKESIPDSLTSVFSTRNGREVRDGGGIKPDVEVAPDTLPNIAVYIDRLDSMEVMFDWVAEYVANHAGVVPARDFRLSDAEFAEFKQRVVDSGFNYDPESDKALGELEKLARFEGYYDDAKEEFAALRRKLKHDVARDIEREKETIMEMLERDIATAYYYQAGGIENSLRYDKQLKEAVKLLENEDEYNKVLTPNVK
ncbi:MAG: S41 family peptidase [Prevotella sp.]